MAATAGFLSLPMEISVPFLKDPLYLPPIYAVIALLFIFGLVPPLVFLWAVVSRLIKQRWGTARKPFPVPQYFKIPISEAEVKQAKEKKSLATRFWSTVLKTQTLGDWPTTTQEKENDSSTTNDDDSTNVLKIWKQKTKQLLINELIPKDKYRSLNFTVRASIANPKEMIIFGCLHVLEGPLDETFMQHAFVKKEIPLRQRIRACSDVTQRLFQLVQEPDKYSKDQYCFLCCMKIKKKKKGYMGSGQIFIDDMFEGRPVDDDDSTTTKEAETEDDETIRISICFPVCSKECLMNCVKVLHEISQTRDTKIEIRGQEEQDDEEEEEKKEEVEDTCKEI